jgi:hypothetical protein
MFEVRFVFLTNGDQGVVGLIGLIAQRLPEVLQATAGTTSFRPWKEAVLTVEVFADDASDAVAEATKKVRLAFELSSKQMPSDFSVEAKPAEGLELEGG